MTDFPKFSSSDIATTLSSFRTVEDHSKRPSFMRILADQIFYFFHAGFEFSGYVSQTNAPVNPISSGSKLEVEPPFIKGQLFFFLPRSINGESRGRSAEKLLIPLNIR
ncbi:hypothetical protein V6N13_079931 [Hibiscus sabdariffa]